MKNLFVLILFILINPFVYGQSKMLSITDAVLGTYGKLAPSIPGRYQWTKEQNSFSMIERNSLTLYQIAKDGNHGYKTVSLSKINAALRLIGADSLKYFPRIVWKEGFAMQFKAGKSNYTYYVNENRCERIFTFPDPLANMQIEKNNRGLSGTDGENLHIVYQLKDGSFQKIFAEQDEVRGTVFGQAVHRNEFGINQGVFWSPNGNKVAYYTMDETMVTDYPIYQLKDTPASAQPIKYPVAGAPSHHVNVLVFDLQKEKKIKLENKFPKEDYWTNVSWGPNEKYIYITHLNRAQNHAKLCQYDAQTGDWVKTLFEEKNEKYVEPEHPLTFLKDKPEQFIWWSEKDGYQHLYLYNTTGKMLEQLTKGKWVVTDLIGVDESQQQVYFMATKDSPLERHLYAVSLVTKKIKKLTQEKGTHRVWPNADYSLFFDYFSNTSTPAKLQMISGKNGKSMEIFHVAENPLQEYKLGEMQLGTIQNKNQDDLYYRLIKPIDFDPNKKYPVVVYLYNGPHVQLVKNSWLGGSNLWYQYMAQNGYVVFTIDGRGSANRGFDFESGIHRQMGSLEMEDQVVGLDWLKSKRWVDSSRIGVHGWSYGGFMTTSLMTRKPGLFKVGVAGGPVIDWQFYEIMYTERYMDHPQKNPKGYQQANLMNYVDQLQGKLLMIHGGQDDVVLWQHSLNYLQKAISLGVQLDYFVYPHHAHNVLGKERVHLYEKISNYFFENL